LKALLLLLVCGTAAADPLAKIVEARLAPVVPAGFGIAKVFAPAIDVAPASVMVEVPGELKQGRPSVRVTVKGKTSYVPVSIAKLVDVAVATHALEEGAVIAVEDFTIEARAAEPGAPAASLVGATVSHALAQGAPIARTDVILAPPLARGTQVTLEVRHGSVRVHGTATLEASARPGGNAIVRVAQTKTVIHGILVAPATVVVGDLP
jgi:flagella basal body P-ring formation protein FlgA